MRNAQNAGSSVSITVLCTVFKTAKTFTTFLIGKFLAKFLNGHYFVAQFLDMFIFMYSEYCDKKKLRQLIQLRHFALGKFLARFVEQPLLSSPIHKYIHLLFINSHDIFGR